MRWLLPLALVFLAATASAAPFGYAHNGDDSDGPFYRVDFADYSVTLIGNTNINEEIEASAFGPNKSTLYVFADESDTIHTIDLLTGAASLLGPVGFDISDPGMAFCDDDQTMYLISEQGELFSINLTNGAGTLIGSDIEGPTALACSPSGILYSVSDEDDDGRLYQVDKSNGATTLIGSLGLGEIDDGGMDFMGGTLYLALDEEPQNLYTVNLATGAATFVAQLSANNLGFESFVTLGNLTTAVPTLSHAAMFLLLGLMAVFTLQMQRRR